MSKEATNTKSYELGYSIVEVPVGSKTRTAPKPPFNERIRFIPHPDDQ